MSETNNLEKNKEIVVKFFDAFINKKNFTTASQYLGSHYIQHTPYVPDGVDGAKNYFKGFYESFPHAHAEIKKVFAENDHVILYVHFIKEPGSLGLAMMELFRLENNKIVEHWNVGQNIPETSANSNTMF